MKTNLREKVCEYVKEKYKSQIESLWSSFPNFVVFRRNDNKKWYGIIMDIAYEKLGLNKHGKVDVLNVKVDWFLKDLLSEQQGILPAYHMNKNKWISVLLDGSVDLEDVLKLIDVSYNETANNKKVAK